MNATANRLPPIASTSAGTDLVVQINNRLARLQMMTTAQASGGLTHTGTAAAATQLMLAVPGTLGTSSSAAPLAMLPASATPSALVAILKQAPVGGSLTVTLSLATGLAIGSLTIPAGATQASGTAAAEIPANTVLVLSTLCGGLTFPGSDLTLLVQF